MKLIQARIPEAEYEILRRRARQQEKTMQEVIREALRAHLLPDTVDPTDPIFTELPVFHSKGGRRVRASERHDKILYGGTP